jgi:phosphohistidine phosphatase
MALFLVQHGKSLAKEQDPERGLSEQGIKEVEHMANTARKHNIQVSCIKHSGKKRARQTAELLASALNPAQGIQQTSGLGPMDDVTRFAQTLRHDENLMLVGHLPFMEKLTSWLITHSTDKPVLKFQNGGIVCLEQDPDGQWIIKWTLVPHIA